MRKQKIKNKGTYLTEPIYNIALYYCNKNFDLHKRNSTRALFSIIVITDYLHNITKKVLEKKGK